MQGRKQKRTNKNDFIQAKDRKNNLSQVKAFRSIKSE